MAAPGEKHVDAAVAQRATVAARLAAVFGPRPIESIVWGAGLGLIAGAPLILSNFVLHGLVVTIVAGLMSGEPFELDTYGDLVVLTGIVGVIAVAGTIGISMLVARLRRANLATMLLTAYFASVLPYVLFFFLVIGG